MNNISTKTHKQLESFEETFDYQQLEEYDPVINKLLEEIPSNESMEKILSKTNIINFPITDKEPLAKSTNFQ